MKETEQQLLERIGKEAYDIVRNAATEKPFTGKYEHHFEKGIYVDIVSGEALFSSSDKFDSGCGWPAFSKPIGKLKEQLDTSLNCTRTEVRSQSDSHLGHVFHDGPKELGGLRYCINSASLRFIPLDKMKEEGYEEYIETVE